jgi:hypothetical protein
MIRIDGENGILQSSRKGWIIIKAWWDLSKDEKIKRSIKCAIGSVIITLVFICLAIHSDMEAQKLRERCTETVTGEVISVFPATKSRFQSYLTAHYVVNDVTYKAEGHYLSGFSSHDTLSRKPVTVHYDPSAPDVSYAADDPRTDGKILFIIIAGVFGIGAIAFVGQAMRIRQS